MRALIHDNHPRFVQACPDPRPPEGECRVRVHWAGICTTDLEIAKGYMGFTGVLGHEFVGTVESGSAALAGRRVVGEINCPCRSCDLCHAGLASHCRHRTVMGISGRDGCFADHVALPEHNLHPVPDGISDEEAVFVEPLAAAYQVVNQCPIDARTSVAVIGSGRLGLLIAQVLGGIGCPLVVIGRNPRTLLFCDRKHIQTLSVDQVSPQRKHDVVVECSGAPEGLELAMELVRPRGTIILKSTYAQPGRLNLAPLVIHEVRVLGSRCGPFGNALDALARKEIDVASMISRTYRLEQGIEALEAAAQPENIKILLKINPR